MAVTEDIIFMVFLALGIQQITPVYNYQILLDLQLYASDLVRFIDGEHKSLPPLLSGIPAYLYQASAEFSRQKCHCRCGKHICHLVKLKACLVHFPTASRNLCDLSPPVHVSQRFLDPIDTCLVPVVAFDEGF